MGEVEGLQTSLDQNDSAVNASVQSFDPESEEVQVEALCSELQARLPKDLFDIAAVRLKYPMSRVKSMNSVLVQELERFNGLLQVIKQSLSDLLLSLRGESVSSEASESLFRSVLLGEVPKKWQKLAYPGFTYLGGFIADLRKRLASFENWVQNGPPPVFWLPAFFSP
jgi:dynein heavy chain, axonemal